MIIANNHTLVVFCTFQLYLVTSVWYVVDLIITVASLLHINSLSRVHSFLLNIAEMQLDVFSIWYIFHFLTYRNEDFTENKQIRLFFIGLVESKFTVFILSCTQFWSNSWRGKAFYMVGPVSVNDRWMYYRE